jgi:hypothetical protein
MEVAKVERIYGDLDRDQNDAAILSSAIRAFVWTRGEDSILSAEMPFSRSQGRHFFISRFDCCL